MSTKIKFETDKDNAPAISADVDHAAVNTEKEDNVNLGLVQQGSTAAEELKLDDARRVKAVSPGMLVAKRFFRNKLALVGLGILIALFLFCFLGAAIYPYSEKDVFMTTKEIQFDYAFGKINTDYSNVFTEEQKPGSEFVNMTNSNILTMKKANADSMVFVDGSTGKKYLITKKNNDVYTVEFADSKPVATFVSRAPVGTYTTDKFTGLTVTLDTSDATLENKLKVSYADSKKTSSVSVAYGEGTYTLVKGKVVLTYNALKEASREEGITDEMMTAAKDNLDGSFTVADL